MHSTPQACESSVNKSPNSRNPAELAQARDVAIRWEKNIAKFDSEPHKSGIASGDFYLVQGYAGDLLQVYPYFPRSRFRELQR